LIRIAALQWQATAAKVALEERGTPPWWEQIEEQRRAMAG